MDYDARKLWDELERDLRATPYLVHCCRCKCVLEMAALPPHFNVNAIELMPVCQSFSATSLTRDMA